MKISFQAARAAARALRAGWQSMVVRLRRRSHELAGIWRYAKARDEFNRLPDAMLRDLGMHRSEFGSFFVESEGRTAPTRRRIVQTVDTRGGR